MYFFSEKKKDQDSAICMERDHLAKQQFIDRTFLLHDSSKLPKNVKNVIHDL